MFGALWSCNWQMCIQNMFDFRGDYFKSFSMQILWYLSLFYPNSASYNVTGYFDRPSDCSMSFMAPFCNVRVRHLSILLSFKTYFFRRFRPLCIYISIYRPISSFNISNTKWFCKFAFLCLAFRHSCKLKNICYVIAYVYDIRNGLDCSKWYGQVKKEPKVSSTCNLNGKMKMLLEFWAKYTQNRCDINCGTPCILAIINFHCHPMSSLNPEKLLALSQPNSRPI